MTKQLPIFLCLSIALFGCAAQIEDESEADGEWTEDLSTLPEDDGKADGSRRVSDYTSRGCTTAPVIGLATQIAERMVCLAPDQLDHFAESNDVSFAGQAILPYLNPTAIEALHLAAQSVGNIGIISAFRTLPQQFLLRKWYEQGRCNVRAAARPGNSNHETARALDLQNPSALRRLIDDFGWIATVPGDAVHFEDLSSSDGRGLDVVAFQELWNLNNPGDPIDTDGVYGPETERRLRNSPATGFAMSGCN